MHPVIPIEPTVKPSGPPEHLPTMTGDMLSCGMPPSGLADKSEQFLVGHGRPLEWCEACGSYHLAPSTEQEHATLQCKAPYKPSDGLAAPSRELALEECCKELRDALVATRQVLHDLGANGTFGDKALRMYAQLNQKAS